MYGQITIGQWINPKEKEFDPVKEYAIKGTGFQNGKNRVVEFFKTNNSLKERANFLKQEYGIGGFGIPGEEPNIIKGGDHCSKGNTIEYIDSEGARKEMKVSWEELSCKISELIEKGEYI